MDLLVLNPYSFIGYQGEVFRRQGWERWMSGLGRTSRSLHPHDRAHRMNPACAPSRLSVGEQEKPKPETAR